MCPAGLGTGGRRVGLRRPRARPRRVPGVEQGQRRLWDKVEAVYLRLLSLGRPAREGLGLTVTRKGRQMRMDPPDRPVPRSRG